MGIATEVGAQVGEVAVSLEGALGEDPLEEVVQPLVGKGIKNRKNLYADPICCGYDTLRIFVTYIKN